MAAVATTIALASEEKTIAIVPIKGHNQIHAEALATSSHLLCGWRRIAGIVPLVPAFVQIF
jgi:hypothetical protein